jgi:Rrf2 family iron-sulfur cluster assembly transcriptional regulator
MDIIRRNTDYALRAMVYLAEQPEGGTLSTRSIAYEGDFSYQLACKLMQKLHNAKLVKSSMGPNGGFSLSRRPSKITLLEIVEAIQGPIKLNKCLFDPDFCSRQNRCTISTKLAELQESIDKHLSIVTLEKLNRSSNRAKGKSVRRKKRSKQ